MPVVTLLDELITRYGEDALVRGTPYALDNRRNVRWIVEIDGEELSDADVRVAEDKDHPHLVVVSLVRGDEELEVIRWSKKLYPRAHPASVLRLLGDLRAKA